MNLAAASALASAVVAGGLVGCAGWSQAGGQRVGVVSRPVPAASPERGRALLLQRQDTGCVLCHQIPGLPAGGALGPSLQGLAERSTPAQARERIADARRFNPQTIMPPYLSTEGLHKVAAPYQGQTVLTPQALDDIVSYLFAKSGGFSGESLGATP
jgi:sulfur-oxidizing protein SoxX